MIIILFLTVGSKPTRQFVTGVFEKSSGKKKVKFLQRYVKNAMHFPYSHSICAIFRYLCQTTMSLNFLFWKIIITYVMPTGSPTIYHMLFSKTHIWTSLSVDFWGRSFIYLLTGSCFPIVLMTHSFVLRRPKSIR